MPAWKPPSDVLFARAVEARAAGGGWEAVGKQVGRSARTVRRWHRLYAERWAAAVRAAARAVVDEAANESVLTLRKLLSSQDDKVRVQAAWRLIYQRLELCKLEQKAGGPGPSEPPSDAYRYAQLLQESTHDERMQFLVDFFRGRIPLCLSEGAGAGARAG